MDTTLTSYFTLPSSLHPTLSILLTPHFSANPNPNCHLHTFISLPDSLFVDPYELQDIWGPPVLPKPSNIERVLKNKGFLDDEVGEQLNPVIWYLTPNDTDLESPVQEGRPTILNPRQHATLHLVLEVPTSYSDDEESNENPSLHIQIPLHARYLQPSQSSSSFVDVFNPTFLLTAVKQALGLSPHTQEAGVIRVGGGDDDDADVKVFGWWACPNQVNKKDDPGTATSFLSHFFQPKEPEVSPLLVPLHLHLPEIPYLPHSALSQPVILPQGDLPQGDFPPSSTISSTLILPKGDLSHLPLVQLGTVLAIWIVWGWVGREVWRTVRRMKGKRKEGHVVVRHRDRSINDDGL